MTPALSSLILTAAGFAAGWAGVRFWHVSEIPRAAPAVAQPAPVPATAVSSAAVKSPLAPLARQLRAQQQTAALTAAEAKALIQRLPYPVPADERDYWQEVLTIWAEAEPQAAANWLREFARKGGVPMEWVDCLVPLARRDLRAALTITRSIFGFYHSAPLIEAAAESDPRGTLTLCETAPQGWSIASAAFGPWLRKDPDAALAWLRTSSLLKYDSFVSSVVGHLSAVAPERMEELLAVVPESARASALSAIAAVEVLRDPGAALAQFSIRTAAERVAMMEPLAEYIAEQAAPEEAGRFLSGLTREERVTALSHLKDRLDYVSPDRLLSLLQSPQFTPRERNDFIARSKTLGLEHAATFMAAVKEGGTGYDGGEVRDFWQRNLVEHPGATAAAMREALQSGSLQPFSLLWLAKKMNEEGQTRPLREVLDALPPEYTAMPRALLTLREAFNDPAADLNGIAQQVPDKDVRQQVLEAVFQNPGSPELHEKAAALLQRLPPAQQVEALRFFSIQRGSAEPMAPLVRGLLESSTGRAEDLTRAAQSVAANLSHVDGAAMQWAEALPSGPVHDAARGSAFYSWVRQDAVGASAWLDTQPREFPKRDDMVTQLATQISASDPERAWHWAATATNPATRQHLQEKILPKWLATDPEAARAAAPLAPPSGNSQP